MKDEGETAERESRPEGWGLRVSYKFSLQLDCEAAQNRSSNRDSDRVDSLTYRNIRDGNG